MFYFIYKNHFLGVKLRIFFLQFFEILPKFSYFVNSDNCIRKITSKYIILQPVFKNRLKKQIFSSEKMRNPGKCIYDYALCSSEWIHNSMRYTGYLHVP